MNTETQPKIKTLQQAWDEFQAGPLATFPENLQPMLKLCFFCGALSDYLIADNIARETGDDENSQAEFNRLMLATRKLIRDETSSDKVAMAIIRMTRVKA